MTAQPYPLTPKVLVAQEQSDDDLATTRPGSTCTYCRQEIAQSAFSYMSVMHQLMVAECPHCDRRTLIHVTLRYSRLPGGAVTGTMSSTA